MSTLTLQVDADGIATIILDDPSKPMNVVSPELIDELIAAIERVAGDDMIKGAIITSAKPAFMAGADLKYILRLQEDGITPLQALEFARKPSLQMHRRLETCGKPFVAAINGLALGGGFEMALACHHRILVDDPKAVVGLPEVTVGLLAGSGGTQRLTRLIGLANALPLLVDGKTLAPAEALELGLVDEVVPAGELTASAKRWLLGTPNPVQPWDRPAWRNGVGLLDPNVAALTSVQPARIAAATQRNYPAPIANLAVAFEGSMMPFDKALSVEAKYFAKLITSAVSRNLIRTGFVNRGEAAKLIRRPAGVPKATVKKLGVLGAGMMGSGIAQVAATAGIDVVLLDSSLELAKKGRNDLEKALDKAVERGKQDRDSANAILTHISATADYADLAGADLIVEAVFEDSEVKAGVTRQAEAVIPNSAIFASNTSTLPISGLAQASARPQQFIGLHFFSPVERMPLVEVIVGDQTSQETLAKALDFVGQLRKVPIVVRDSRGFYTSRVFQTFIHEGMKMLEDGVEPARIENAAKQAGFPVGPLALVDEVTVELPWKIVKEAEAALGDKFIRPCAYEVMRRMLEEIKRPGKRHGKGFYEYPADGRKFLWPGLAQAFPPTQQQPGNEELKQRFLYIQALETARCLEEGVLSHPADADVGALLAWGFPSWTGGPLSLIDTVGIRPFVAELEQLAALHGPRFAASAWLKSQAKSGTPFYRAA